MVNEKLFLIKNYIESILIEKNLMLVPYIIHEIKDYALDNNITNEVLQGFKLQKKKERGGFDNKVFCYLFLIHKLDNSILEYRNKSNQYSEIFMSNNFYSNEYIAFTCNKLVRDKLPERMVLENRIAFYRYLKGIEFTEALLKKLLEEYNELFHAKTEIEIIEEAVDMLEVLEALSQ
jgi:predicted house-cleaning noncanonical NTP pyrophosphatase (MazG superfamily)